MTRNYFFDEWGNQLDELENYLNDTLVYKGNAFRYNRKWYKILDRELIKDETDEVIGIKALMKEITPGQR